MQLINLTPHKITIIGNDGKTMCEIAPSGTIARAASVIVDSGTVDGIPVVRTSYGLVEGLPAPIDGTMYIVSSLTATAARRSGRTIEDLLIPGRMVRDEEGVILGCQALSRA